MNAPKTHEILDCPIQQLEISNEVKRAMNANQIKTMRELIKYSTQEIERWPGFDIGLVHEYVSYMEERGMGSLIDPR